MSLVVIIPQIVEAKCRCKIMTVCHYTASIITHYHTPNMVAIFADCTLGEPQAPSLCHHDI